MKPQVGIWQGTLLVRGQSVALPITLQIEEANENGSLNGRLLFNTQSERWSGSNDGAFVQGRYSPFGTLHLEQVNAANSSQGKSRLTVDARFEVSDEANGALWGSVLVTPPEDRIEEDAKGYSGILVAAHVDDKRVTRAAVWA